MSSPGDGPAGNGFPGFPQLRFRRPSKGRIVVSVVIGALLLLLFSARSLSSFYVNVL